MVRLQAAYIFLSISVFLTLQLYNNPYSSSRLQTLHVLSLTACLQYIMVKWAILHASDYTGEISKATMDRVSEKILKISRAYDYIDSNKD